jgi:hypothetical protein
MIRLSTASFLGTVVASIHSYSIFKEFQMNKRVSMVLVIAIVAGGTIFAAGTGERPSNVEPGRRLTADTTEVSITGTIAYRDDVPILITDDGVFSLSARRGGLYSSDLEDGMGDHGYR